MDNQELDSFELEAKKLLSPNIFEKLIHMRNEYMLHLYKDYDDNPNLTGKELNALHDHFFKEVAKLIGDDKYELLFGFPASQEVHLIDEKIFDEQQALRKI